MNQNQSNIGLMDQLMACAKKFASRDDVEKCVSLVELGTISLNCKNCTLKFSTCIITKCSGPCLKEDADHNHCEKCAKVVGCSLYGCNGPN